MTKKKPVIDNMIKWRLRVLMAERKISNKQLAEMTGIHRVTISRLKNMDELTQISGDVLNSLCKVLDVHPGDLLIYESDDKEPAA